MKNKFLHKEFVEINKNETLPANYIFTQLYSLDDGVEEKTEKPDVIMIEIKANQVPFTCLYPSFHKPISKMFKY